MYRFILSTTHKMRSYCFQSAYEETFYLHRVNLKCGRITNIQSFNSFLDFLYLPFHFCY